MLAVATSATPYIEGRYIVVTQAGTKGSVQTNDAFLAHVKGENVVPHTSWNIGGTFRGHLFKDVNETLFHALEQAPGVLTIEPDQLAYSSEIQHNPPSWGLERVWNRDLPLTKQYQYSETGEGVDIYLTDTGVYCEHNDFTGRCSWGWTSPDTDGGDADCNGHGTHCAGTAAGTTYGVAKKANLIAVKVLGCSGSGSYSGIMSSFQWISEQAAITKRPSIISLSLGGGRSDAVNQALDALTGTGVHNSVAAGNDYYADACTKSPAGASTAFTVASATNTDLPSSFSNVGNCVQVWAPGSSITSAWIGGVDAKNTISGTSMACPHVTGTMALFLSNGNLDPKELGAMVQDTATPGKIKYGTNVNLNKTPNLNLFTNPHV